MSGIFPVLDAPSGWHIAPDAPPPPLASRAQAVLIMNLLDEITNLPPNPPPDGTSTTVGMLARVDADGDAGLACVPLTRFLGGSVTGSALQITLSGSNYISRSLTATLGAQPGYPQSFSPATLGTVVLHRAPLMITGRVVDDTHASLVGAAVTVDGIWPTLASLTSTAAAPNLIASMSPLYADRNTAATVAAQTLTPAAATKTLLKPGNVGDTTLRLSDQAGLAVGSIVGLDQPDLARGEYVTVQAITHAGLTPQQPATAVLDYPLARPHAADAVAIPMVVGATGAPNALARAAQLGDVTLFPAAMSGLVVGMSAVVIAGGGPVANEYHAANLYAATSNASGGMVLPPIHRLAQLRLRVHHASEPTDLLSTVPLPMGVSTLSLNLAFP